MLRAYSSFVPSRTEAGLSTGSQQSLVATASPSGQCAAPVMDSWKTLRVWGSQSKLPAASPTTGELVKAPWGSDRITRIVQHTRFCKIEKRRQSHKAFNVYMLVQVSGLCEGSEGRVGLQEDGSPSLSEGAGRGIQADG
jgi:hypothetical protein